MKNFTCKTCKKYVIIKRFPENKMKIFEYFNLKPRLIMKPPTAAAKPQNFYDGKFSKFTNTAS